MSIFKRQLTQKEKHIVIDILDSLPPFKQYENISKAGDAREVWAYNQAMKHIAAWKSGIVSLYQLNEMQNKPDEAR